ncbi:hypothetical protein [Sandaracinus amylolyticus]|nr:hypothetical protein [Sandaracinus amylolyticus]
MDATAWDGGGADAAVVVEMDATVAIDASPIDAGAREDARDAGHDAWTDPCEDVVCPGDACREGRCDPRSGECVLGAPRADGTSCDDGDLCTRADACERGACVGGDAITCPPIDACHSAGTCEPATGECSTVPAPCTIDVVVRVLDARGVPLTTAVPVRAFQGERATPVAGKTDAAGEVHLQLTNGAYRFRVLRDGVPFWSGAGDHCAMPSCTRVEMRLPDTSDLRVVTWDPRMDGAYDGGGEVRPPNPHIERGGTWLENWAIERYGAPDAFISAGHTHLYPQDWDPPDAWGNTTTYENQHAFGAILQGVYVRLSDRRAFDLVSIDYRVRHDTDPEHVSAIPGADPTNVEIWVSSSLTVPTTAWTRYPTGVPIAGEMTYWGTVFPHEMTNVSAVFITTTGNVSLDNVVLRPR